MQSKGSNVAENFQLGVFCVADSPVVPAPPLLSYQPYRSDAVDGQQVDAVLSGNQRQVQFGIAAIRN